MLKYNDTTEMPLRFGDFGGNDSIGDFELGRLNPDISFIRQTITGPEFEKEFRKMISCLIPEFSIRKEELAGGRTVWIAPALGKKYVLAASLAYAKTVGKKEVSIGSGSRELVEAAVSASRENDLGIQIILGRELCGDSEFVQKLKDQGAQVDDVTCVKYFDLPYSYLIRPFVPDPEAYILQTEANYGIWPRPGLTGIFAGLYGADLLDKLGHVPEACVVPVRTGTNAVGVFKGFAGTGCRMATAEMPVAEEIHTVNVGAYTIAVRSADTEGINISICPELVNMWRNNQVLRLGCDRLYAVDTRELEERNISRISARAAALAFEKTGCKELLAVEVRL